MVSVLSTCSSSNWVPSHLSMTRVVDQMTFLKLFWLALTVPLSCCLFVTKTNGKIFKRKLNPLTVLSLSLSCSWILRQWWSVTSSTESRPGAFTSFDGGSTTLPSPPRPHDESQRRTLRCYHVRSSLGISCTPVLIHGHSPTHLSCILSFYLEPRGFNDAVYLYSSTLDEVRSDGG